MRVHIDVERFAQASQQVLLVHLGISLDCLILNPGGNLSQLSQGLGFQAFITVWHF
jgi:hypothetical protein